MDAHPSYNCLACLLHDACGLKREIEVFFHEVYMT